MRLDQPLDTLTGIGPRGRELLRQIGLETIQDLLFHLPNRYQDRTRITPIAALREGDWALVEGVIRSATVSAGSRANLLCELSDERGGIVYLRFFHFTAAQIRQLTAGVQLRCFGEARRAFQRYGLEIIHPEYRHCHQAHELPIDQHLTPVYPAPSGLSQPLLRRLTDQALDCLDENSQSLELLPLTLLEPLGFPSLSAALRYVHRPPPDAPVDVLLRGEHPMQQRLAFEELVAQQLSHQRCRQQARQQSAMPLPTTPLQVKFLATLSFQLTSAQQRVITEINDDLAQAHPMLRLLQGDVGSGKTVVAALAMLNAVAHGAQAALSVPTEILAEQHFQQFLRWFTPLGITIVFLGGKQTAAARTAVLAQIASGAAQMIIGTHALFQEKVHYDRLALAVIDEQHRFGVNQRLALREKGENNGVQPHQLIMSATPIPRTLAMAAYADLDISIIDELPPGRKPIVTALISNRRRQQVIERVQTVCRQRKQVYWVCTLITESEALQCQTAEETARQLQAVLPDLRIGLVHSHLSPEEKTLQMQAFKAGTMDLLVATTVIEVGVDVPNASLMIIENPERLGLSQLHQLRGRVGRGSAESFCLLLYQEPLTVLARQRLQVMRNTQDGFVIAREDLAIRGPGEVLGTRQSGLARLKIADLMRDQHLLPQAQAFSRQLLEAFPTLISALMSRWTPGARRYLRV